LLLFALALQPPVLEFIDSAFSGSIKEKRAQGGGGLAQEQPERW